MFAKDLGHGDPMDGRKALAKAFGAYVDDRGLTQTDVAARGGPSTTSQTKIRKTTKPVSPQTLQKIDKVTGWPPGTSARIIAGSPEPGERRTIRSYSDDELVEDIRRRLRERGKSDDVPAQPKSSDDVDVQVRRNVRRLESQPQPVVSDRSPE
jgi:hypothetical protein